MESMIKGLRLVQMGNTMGVRIPEALVDKYGLQGEVVLEEREEGLLIHAARADTQLSSEETYRQMAADDEDWSDWHNLPDEDQL
jgi:antitoxin MazE